MSDPVRNGPAIGETTSGDGELDQTARAAATTRDPVVALPAVAALRRLVEDLESLHVANARDQGWSWREIADSLGVTKQTVHRKHRRR